MPPLLICQGLTKAFGAQTLFRNISLNLQPGDKAGLIGPNGSGKSTLLKILCNLEGADQGEVHIQKHTHISFLAQEDQFDEQQTCAENLYPALEGLNLDDAEQYNRVHSLLSRAKFPQADRPVAQLSGGWRKRLAICRALVTRPDVLVLDEPTNHLDIEGIIWLEKLLNSTIPESPAAYLMVSHDRHFLENTVNRIIELGAVYPDGSLQLQGNYSAFLEKKAEFLSQQQQMEERLANKARREIEWLRRGPKARATKAKYRIDEAGRLQEDLAEVRSRNRSVGQVQINFSATNRKTKKLLTAKGISKNFPDCPLFSKLDLTLTPGFRLGLLGRNGTGKSTLMKLLAAASEDQPSFRPDEGLISTAENVRIVSFDQRREQLEKDISLKEALAPDGDSVVYQGRSLHVVTWAKRFLFRPDQLDSPVHRLSGGEQARILIARLMRDPADILLLDEPTNDLDIPSLDVLEESLNDFPGALVLVSHDRYLLESVCDMVLGFDGRGQASFFADYSQWLSHMEELEREEKKSKSVKNTSEQDKKQANKENNENSAQKNNKAGKLSYMDQREYDAMEETILEKEARLEEVQECMALPETQADPSALQAYWQEEQTLQEEVDRLYTRWEELEERKASGQ